MKQSVLLVVGIALVGLVSCKDDEPKVDPIVGLWELDDVSITFSGSEFQYANVSKENALYGESSYTIEFNADFTYEREIDDIPGFGDHSDEGEYEIDGDDLDLDSDDPEVGGLAYSFKIIEKSATVLTLEFQDSERLFPRSKIQEWINDGTIDSNGNFTVTNEQFDSLNVNFAQDVAAKFTLDFDKKK